MMLKKRLAAGLTALCFIVGAVCEPVAELGLSAFGNDVVASADKVEGFAYTDAEVFIADALSSNVLLPDGEIYKPMDPPLSIEVNSREFIFSTVGRAASEESLAYGSALYWQNLEKALKGDFAGMVNWEESMYESLIMDYLAYEGKSEAFRTHLSKATFEYETDILKELADRGVDSLKNMSAKDAEKYAKTLKRAKKIDDLSGKLGDVAKFATNGLEYYQKLSKALAVKQANDDRIAFLKEMKAVSHDTYFSNAVDKVVGYYENAESDSAFDYLDDYATEFLIKTAWGTFVKDFTLQLKIYVGETAAANVKDSLMILELGTAGFDWFFNTDETSKAMLESVAVYTMGVYAGLAYQNFRDDYVASGTFGRLGDGDKARAYVDAYHNLIAYKTYANTVVNNYLFQKLGEGFWNHVYNMITDTNVKTYYDWAGAIESDKQSAKIWIDSIDNFRDMYCSFAGITNDSDKIKVTGVSFAQKEITVSLSDYREYPIPEPADLTVTPANASNQRVTFTSSNYSIAKIDNGSDYERLWIIPVSVGTATIEVTTADGGYTDTITVHVVEESSGTSSGSTSKRLAAGKTFKIGKITYEVLRDTTTVAVSKADKDIETANISKYVKYDGVSYKVTSIGGGAFYNCDGLTSITIPNSVTSIGNEAFSWCLSLTRITISDSVTSIGDFAFSHCERLSNITIPNSVTKLGHTLFYECVSLKKVILSNRITELSSYPYDPFYWGFGFFCGCTSLTNIIIPDSVISIGDLAFAGCESLTNIVIPDSVTSVGDHAFWGCSSLTSITIPNSVTSIGDEAFRDCTSLTSITIPDSITSISTGVFVQCTSLTSLTIPNSVTSIGILAFEDCTSLTNVYYSGTKSQWNNIKIDNGYSGNDALKKAIIHCSDGTIVGNHTHSYTGNITKQPTCTKDGVMTYTCDCGDTYTEAIPAKGHTWNEGEITKSPTCTEDGFNTYTCADCGETKTEAIPATGHSFVNKTVAPTYDAQGFTEHTCSVCGYSYKDSYTPKKQRKSISGATISISGKQYVYTGKALKPAFTVKLDGVTLRSGTDYTAAFKNNKNCGKATVTVTGKGNYIGSKTANFIIKPSKAVLSKVTSPKTKQIKVTWKKSAGGVTGYEIMTASDKSFKKNKKTTTITSGSTTSKTITKLKAKTTYYAKVRAYKTVGKTKYYGAWSSIKNVKTK